MMSDMVGKDVVAMEPLTRHRELRAAILKIWEGQPKAQSLERQALAEFLTKIRELFEKSVPGTL